MVSIRDRVKDFYMTIPELELGWLFHVCTNEKCDYNGYYEGLVNAPVLINHHKVESISQAEKDLVSLLGFTLKEFSHVRYQEGGGTSTCRHCHVQYNGRELSASELWLPDIKQRAIDLGFVVKTSFDPKCCSGWGINTDVLESITDDGISETTNTTFGETLTNWNKLKIEVYSGHVKFYINEVMKADHTTNLPDFPMYINFHVDTVAGGAATIELGVVRAWTEDIAR